MSDSAAAPSPPAQETQVAEVVTAQRTGAGPICQVPGCSTADLTSTKGYHFRHRICEFHAKAQEAEVNGCLQRFCQQCGRFHEIAAFNGTQRSCKATLNERSDRRRLLRKLRRQEEAKMSGDGDGVAADDSKEPGIQFLQGLLSGSPSPNKIARGCHDADKRGAVAAGGAAAGQQQQSDAAVAAAAGIIGAQSRIMAAISAFLPMWDLSVPPEPTVPPPVATPWASLLPAAGQAEGDAAGRAAPAPPAASFDHHLPASILRLQQNLAAQRSAPPPSWEPRLSDQGPCMPMYAGLDPHTTQVLMTAMAVAQQQDEAQKTLISAMAVQQAAASHGEGAAAAERVQVVESSAVGPLAAIAEVASLAAAGKIGVDGGKQPQQGRPITPLAARAGAGGVVPNL